MGQDERRGQGAQVPMRAITRGPGYHWFGYYDKLQFDPTSRYVLAMAVDFEHRPPRPDEEIRIGVIDLEAGDAWRTIGATSAWCWQQGCMLQWLPGSASEVIWNERAGDHYAARITDVFSGASRTIPAPVYALAPDGRSAIGPDFRRLGEMRPGYGYEGLPDPCRDQLAPEDSGIHRVDLRTGAPRQLISVAQAAAVPYPHADLSPAKHYFNHLLFNPDGSRFIFLHRWRIGGSGIRTPACSPPRPTAPTCTWWTTTAPCPTSSGAIPRPSWPPLPAAATRRRRVTPPPAPPVNAE